MRSSWIKVLVKANPGRMQTVTCDSLNVKQFTVFGRFDMARLTVYNINFTDIGATLV